MGFFNCNCRTGCTALGLIASLVSGIVALVLCVVFSAKQKDVKNILDTNRDNVVVIGGGLTGCEIAYELYLKGKKPAIVEMQDDLITTKGVCLANTSYLRDFFKTNKVPVHLETRLLEITDGGVKVADKEGKSFDIAADSVILSVGYKPAPLVAKGKNIHVIGDASKVGNLRTVIWQAWDVAMKL